MFEDRGYKRTFYSAPQSVTSLVAAFLEPSITVLVFLAALSFHLSLFTRSQAPTEDLPDASLRAAQH